MDREREAGTESERQRSTDRQGERGRERQTDRDRNTEKQTLEGKSQRETESHRGRGRARNRERQREGETVLERERQIEINAQRQRNGQIESEWVVFIHFTVTLHADFFSSSWWFGHLTSECQSECASHPSPSVAMPLSTTTSSKRYMPVLNLARYFSLWLTLSYSLT